jgi:hypothetical protein
MQTNYRVKCNMCEINIESKHVLEHTSAKEHKLKKTTLECELLNLTSMKRDLEDFSVISMWIAGLPQEEKNN